MSRRALEASCLLLLLAGIGCDGGTNPASSGYVVTCVNPSGTVWSGDGAATTVHAIVTRSGASVTGAPLTFTASAGTVTSSVSTDVNGFGDADYFPPFAPGPVTVTVELRDGADLLGDDTCTFSVTRSLTTTAALAGGAGTILADPDCDVPLTADADVTVTPVGGLPASVARGVRVTGYRASWRRQDGTGQPGVDVPRDLTGTLAAGPQSAPVTFPLVGLPVIMDADIPALACGDEVVLLLTLSFDVDPTAGSEGLATELTVPVTFHRSCQPCP